MRRFQVLNEFRTYDKKGKLVVHRRGAVLAEPDVSTWPNLNAMIGTMLMEVPGLPDPATVPAGDIDG